MRGESLCERTVRGDVLNIPRRFKNYVVDDLIGVGTCAVVVGVTDICTNEKFAAKVMMRPPANTDALKLLERELRLGDTISYPYLVNCIEALYLNDVIILVMERGTGKDLRTMISEDLEEIADRWRLIFRQLCLAVAYLHEKGLTHSDLKLDNVLVDDNYNCKLCDYGLMFEAKKADCSVKPLCETPSFMAPETLRCQKYCSKAADVWSLGVILYTMLTGNSPWRSEDNEGIVREISEGITNFEGISDNQKEVIMKCCDLNPETRWTVDDILASPLVRATGSWASSNLPVKKGKTRRCSGHVAPKFGARPIDSMFKMTIGSRLGPRMKPNIPFKRRFSDY